MNASSPSRAFTISTVATAAFLCAAALSPAAGCRAVTSAPPLETEEFMVPSGDPGIDLYVRNKHKRGIKAFAGERVLLFVHGATYPAETTFDLKLAGIL